MRAIRAEAQGICSRSPVMLQRQAAYGKRKDAASRQTPEFDRNRQRSSLCHGGLPALRCHVFSWGHSKSDAPIWRVTTMSIYNPQHHRTATSAPRLSSTRFIRMASCHSDKTLFVRRPKGGCHALAHEGDHSRNLACARRRIANAVLHRRARIQTPYRTAPKHVPQAHPGPSTHPRQTASRPAPARTQIDRRVGADRPPPIGRVPPRLPGYLLGYGPPPKRT